MSASLGNPIGVSTWLWVSPPTDRELARLAPAIRAWGFDAIEVPIEHLGDWSPSRLASIADGEGLAVTTCAVTTADRDLSTADPNVVQSTQDYLKACVDVAAAVGAPVVAGPIYAPVGRTWRMDERERADLVRRLAANLRPVAEHAGAQDVRLALEPLNRYETCVVNTVAQAIEIVDEVGVSSLGLCLDTFHLNIEEKDPAEAARLAGPRIHHVQACGTDRGTPGSDRFDWPAFVAALRSADYRGAVCIESFTNDNDAIARAASIWRRPAPTQDALATDGLAFLRRAFGNGFGGQS